METARQITPPATAPPLPPSIPRARPRIRVVPDPKAAHEEARPTREDAREQLYCFECRHARVDRARSRCVCTSVSSESSRREVFSGQEACGWFAKRRLTLRWPLYSARKL